MRTILVVIHSYSSIHTKSYITYFSKHNLFQRVESVHTPTKISFNCIFEIL